MNQQRKVLLLLGILLLAISALAAGGVIYYRHATRLRWAEHRKELGEAWRAAETAARPQMTDLSTDEMLERAHNTSNPDREQIVRLLAGRPDPQLHGIFSKLLKDRDFANRAIGVQGLGLLHAAGDFDALKTALADPVPDVQSEAALSLGEFHDTRALPLLKELLAHSTDFGVQFGASEGLALLGGEGIEAVRAKIAQGPLAEGDPLVTGLAEAARQPNVDSAAIQALVEICRNHPDANARGDAAQGLARRHEPDAVAAYEAALHDRDGMVREMALFVMPQDDRSLRLLESMVHDPQPAIRVKVGVALSRIGDPRVDDIFDRAVKEQNVPLIAGAYGSSSDRTDGATAVLLIEGLQKYGTQEMAQTLMNHGNYKVARAAEQWAKDRGYQIYYQYVPSK